MLRKLAHSVCYLEILLTADTLCCHLSARQVLTLGAALLPQDSLSAGSQLIYVKAVSTLASFHTEWHDVCTVPVHKQQKQAVQTRHKLLLHSLKPWGIRMT